VKEVWTSRVRRKRKSQQKHWHRCRRRWKRRVRKNWWSQLLRRWMRRTRSQRMWRNESIVI
jgi:hypothetical protein